MTTWEDSFTATNGIHVHYLRTGGAKPPVVLLHGLLGSGACWCPIARALEAEYDVVMPDARGHAGTSAPQRGYQYNDLANDVEGLIHALELSSPVILGHSMGGMTAALVASRCQGMLRGLVMVDPTFLRPERQREVFQSDVAEEHRRTLGLSKEQLIASARDRHPRRTREIIELQVAARLRTSIAAFDVLRPPNPDYHALVRALDIPSLLVIGDEPVVTLQTATELQSSNPCLQVAQIGDAGHGLPFDQPEALAKVVASFLRRFEPS